MSKIKFYNSLKNLSVEIENIKNENVGVWLEENIVHIQNNNELIGNSFHKYSFFRLFYYTTIEVEFKNWNTYNINVRKKLTRIGGTNERILPISSFTEICI